MGICRHHPVRLNTTERPIVNQYCEGKVKSTPNRRVKGEPETMRLQAVGALKWSDGVPFA